MTLRSSGSSLDISGVTKRYGGVLAVDDVSMRIEPGEFVALLGPSGSGKTTLLMTIAGFEQPNAGALILDGRDITGTPPYRRAIGMVFQRYALFPHLSVAENLAYPLRRRGRGRKEIEGLVRAALDQVQLGGLGGRFPHQLSGGQQQRVALARALIYQPGLLLLDEPMSALDRKLRQRLQMEMKLLHRDVGATIVLVTHDQEEALSMADRVAVLHRGRLQQVGTPAELYDRPENVFVAGFVGETNLLGGECRPRSDGAVEVRIPALSGPDRIVIVPNGNTARGAHASGAATLGIRPEHVRLARGGDGYPGTVIETVFAGAERTILVRAGGVDLTARVPSGQVWQAGEACTVALDGASFRIFPAGETEES